MFTMRETNEKARNPLKSTECLRETRRLLYTSKFRLLLIHFALNLGSTQTFTERISVKQTSYSSPYGKLDVIQ